MRLFYIGSGVCQHITEIMPGVKAVYQMEQEFAPYLFIEFLPFREKEQEGIILQTKNETIRKNYTFKDKKDIDDLRNLIWHYLRKERHIKNTENENDFRQLNPNHVTQGWQAKKKLSKEDMCCKIISDALVSEKTKTNILHEVYRLNTKGREDKNLCKKLRWGDCGDNFPPNTPTFKRCIDEVNWLCNKGYGPDSPRNKMNELVKKVRTNLYKYLSENGTFVDKAKFDEIIDAGMFTDLGNRMNNDYANIPNVKVNIDKILNERGFYLHVKEGFNDNGNHTLSNFFPIWNKVTGFLLILLVLLFVYVLSKKIDFII